jgi:hypothetical protein
VRRARLSYGLVTAHLVHISQDHPFLNSNRRAGANAAITFLPMKKVARTLRAHRDLILNYFRARKEFSSGVIEGLNNKAKVTMRKSYGFRTFRVTELALYHSLGKLPEPELTHRFF